MDDLILAALQGRLTAEQQRRLDAWRSASETNEQEYQRAQRLWAVSARRDPRADLAGPPPSAALLLDHAAHSNARPQNRRSSSARWIAAAATMAAAASLGLFVNSQRSSTLDRPATAVAPLSASEFITDSAEMVTARLDDGSVVRLASSSRLRVTPVADRREVWLDGEAFIAAARDESRPFVVRTRAGSVEVLGTRFAVRVQGEAMRLVVTEGEVALTAGGERRVVVAGQIAYANGNATPTIENTEDPYAALDWMQGFLVFQNTPLYDAAEEIEERYGIRVLLPDSAVAQRTVTAWFTHQEPTDVLSAVCRAVDARCTYHDGVASIEP